MTTVTTRRNDVLRDIETGALSAMAAACEAYELRQTAAVLLPSYSRERHLSDARSRERIVRNIAKWVIARLTDLAKNPPAPAFDTVSFINAYEAGELEHDEVVEGFQHLIDSGLVWQLQGSYGRAASDLINSGLCTPAARSTK